MTNPKKYTVPAIVILFLFLTAPVFAQQNNPLINSGDLIKKGAALHEEGKFKEAIEVYKQINRSDTNYADALYELCLSYYTDSQMNAALTTAREGLRLFPEKFTRFSMQAANALDDMDKTDEALKVYDAALEKDPHSYILYFNKGVTLYRKEKEEEAAACFQQSLLINPYYASSHYFLGNIYLQRGNIVPAMLAYTTYLMIMPKGKYLNKIITRLNNISKMSDDVIKLVGNKKSSTEDNFDLVQQIVESKIALDKQYKLLVPLEDNIVKQIQVVNEKLEYNAGDKGFAMQYYVPLYIKLFKEGNFEAMVFTLFSGLEIDKVKSWNQKNKKETEVFIAKANDYFNDIRFTRVLQATERKDAAIMYLYQNGKFSGKGPVSDKEKFTLAGTWEFFHDNGMMRSKGAFNSNEKKEGTWLYFYENGMQKEKITFNDDEQNGSAEGWFDNGNKWYTETAKNGQLNGVQTIYFYNSNLRSVTPYTDGKMNGIKKEYRSQGGLISEGNYVNDIQEGLTTFYYANGRKQDELTYKNGKGEGMYKSYYESGKPNIQGEITNGLKQGLWITYFENGAVKEKITYKDNEITGEFTEYYEDGKLSRRGTYAKKKIDGKVEEYDDDGKLYSDALYEKGRLKEISFYDKTGKQVYNTGTRKGAATITFFSPDGIKLSEGYFNRDGNKDGKYTDYFLSGKVSSETNYKDGTEEGESVSYYFNGQKKSESNYTAGNENGYIKGYYFNGRLRYEGWVIEGEKQQQLIFYNQLGDVTTKEYYLNGEQNGYTEYYYPGNVRDFDYKYTNSWLEEIIQYDSTGKIMQVSSLKDGNGPVIFKHYNGKVMAEGSYLHYMLEGVYKTFYFDGSLKSVAYYKKDKPDSTYTEYFYDGVKKTEGQYKNGVKEGVWKYYYTNGKLSEEEPFTNGKLNGIDKLYNMDGTLDKEVNYKNSNLEGPYKIYAGNNELAVEFNYKEDMVKSYTYEDKTGNKVPPIALTGSNGKVNAFFKNGTPSVTMSFTDNDVQGDCKFYYSNGKPYIDGKRDFGYYNGAKKLYYANGTLWMEENYVLGNLQGTRKVYSADGKLQKEENYYNGDLHGTCKYYDVQGKLKQTRLYYYNNLISVN